MTINTQKLRAKRGSIAPVSVARLQEIRDRAFRRLDDNARGDSIYVRANEAIELVAAAQALDDAQAALDVQAAEIVRLREALHRLAKRFEVARDGAEDWFHETGNVYHQGRLVAYDQAAADVRAALQEKSNG